MELDSYNLTPQEQVLIALYLKSMNKSEAAREAGYASTTVFSKFAVKAAVADQLKVRAERLRVGADWVLQQLVTTYEKCSQAKLIAVTVGPAGEPEGVYGLYDPKAALQALTLIGKHVDVKAFEEKRESVVTDEAIAQRLAEARHRVNALPAPVIDPEPMISLATPGQPPVSDPEPVEPPFSFLDPQPSAEPPAEPEPVTGTLVEPSGTVTDLGDDEAMLNLTPSQKLDRMLRHVSTHPRER